MLKDFLAKTSVGLLIAKVRAGGQTVAENLNKNRANSIASYKDMFKRALNAGVPFEQYATRVGALAKTRKRQTLSTLKNMMSSIRMQGRAVIAGNSKGTWYNRGVFDGRTTEICLGYMGKSWDIPYSQIPDKPPRIADTPHPCRSFLTFTPDGGDAPNEAPFMDQFNADEELQLDLLGPTKFEAHKSGELKITSFAQYEKIKLTTLSDLGLK